MGYLYLFLVSLMFSLVGTFVKTASLTFYPFIITFFRFSIGLCFLLILTIVQRQKISLMLLNKWIWIGALSKSIGYLSENFAFSRGFSYGNILVYPVQTIVILCISLLFLKEKIDALKYAGVAACILGVGLITWNGSDIGSLLGKNLFISFLFVLSGAGSAMHVFSQKMLINSMSPVQMNASAFLAASLITAVPLPFTDTVKISPLPASIGSVVALGFITGAAFMLNAKALKTVPLFMSAIFQNFAIVFSLIWAILFFNEEITGWIIGGSALIIGGFLLLNSAAFRLRFQNRYDNRFKSLD